MATKLLLRPNNMSWQIETYKYMQQLIKIKIKIFVPYVIRNNASAQLYPLKI